MSTTVPTTTAANRFAALSTSTAAAASANENATADRFLKLLVTQMQNQDPLNPMDNALKYDATLRFINGTVRTTLDAMKSPNQG